MDIAVSTLEKEGTFHCSKWLKHAVLLEVEELEKLLEEIGPCFLVSATGVVSKGDFQVKKEVFLSWYKKYLDQLQMGVKLPCREIRNALTVMLSSSLENFYAMAVGKDKFLIRAKKPVIQLQMYHCFIAKDGTIHPMALSSDSFSWGLQISYPQIYQDPHTQQFIKVLQSDEFSDAKVYKKIVQWLRNHTKPASLMIKNCSVKAPFRVGKDLSYEYKKIAQGTD